MFAVASSSSFLACIIDRESTAPFVTNILQSQCQTVSSCEVRGCQEPSSAASIFSASALPSIFQLCTMAEHTRRQAWIAEVRNDWEFLMPNSLCRRTLAKIIETEKSHILQNDVPINLHALIISLHQPFIITHFIQCPSSYLSRYSIKQLFKVTLSIINNWSYLYHPTCLLTDKQNWNLSFVKKMQLELGSSLHSNIRELSRCTNTAE